ncbi:MAG: hypothetical protein ABI822_13750 [Bryobacteraceae bacterium]
MIARFSLIAALAGASFAAESQIEGPRLGYIYDQQASLLRPILGIPGSALFGEPLSSELREAVVSPSQDYALGVSGDDSAVAILDLAGARLRPLKGARPSPTKIVISPNGASAAVVSGTHVQVFTEMPGNATAGAEVDLVAEAAALAISDDGELALAVIGESDVMALYSYSKSGAAHRILAAGKISSVEFLNRSHDAVFANEAEGKIVLLRDGTDASLAGAVEAPTAVSASLDNRRIFIASATTQTVTSLSLEDGTSVTTPCGCEPVALARLQGGTAFRITNRTDGPSWIFDAAGAEPRVLFIPQAADRNE